MSGTERSVIWAADRPVPIGVAESAPEEWRPIQGFPGYLISDQGRVASDLNKRGRLIMRASRPKAPNYPHVVLRRDGRGFTRRVHKLVADAFHGTQPSPDMEVRHLNGDRFDSRAVNLAWATHAENMQDTVAHGTSHTSLRTACPSGHPYDEQNTYVLPSRPRARYCRACRAAESRSRSVRRAMAKDMAA